MAIMGCNLSEVKNFINEVAKVRERLKRDEEYLSRVLSHNKEYEAIKSFFVVFAKYLQYSSDITVNGFYRVRKCEGDQSYSSRKELIYPPPCVEHEDRMNNTLFRVLYTSFHEFTAMAETRINDSFIGKHFQLTRFSIDRPIKVFKLGMFSEIHLNSPRDSEFTKKSMEELFGSQGHDGTMKGFSALECAMADILYGTGDKCYVLSSILADAIFYTNPSVEAIMYPSMQNRFGINIAIKKQVSDLMKIEYSCLNRVEEVYANGFYRYVTVEECTDFSDEEKFEMVNIQEPYLNKVRR